MNVFEDLIIELKEENLLESTVMDTDPSDSAYDFSRDANGEHKTSYDLPESIDEGNEPPVEMMPNAGYEASDSPPAPSESIVADDYGLREKSVANAVEAQSVQGKRQARGREFFKKRAMGEVSSLQMVEHVLTGVEREYMKVVPKTFDDFNAKKALHSFLQLDESANSDVHAAAEFALMHETEAWCSALGERDRNVSVPNLRQYCENSRPALSSQALLGLARFYRNLPYSEQVRSKFDFVMTRLFSRPVATEKRGCLFNRDEMLNHINTLYGEWSSIPLYAAEDDQSKVLLTALSFEDLSIEAENASSFDHLIENDFFGRLRMFKESISELFFAPVVTAAAIESNIRVGNAYVSLIDQERQRMDTESLRSKYGTHNDLAVSDATGRTLGLVDLLKELSEAVDPNEILLDDSVGSDDGSDGASQAESRLEQQRKAPGDRESRKEADFETKPSTAFLQQIVSLFKFERLKENAQKVNKWFLAGCLLMIAASFGLYIYSSYVVDDTVPAAGALTLDVSDSILSEHIKVGKISNEIFYGQLLPTWDALSKEKREEYLKKVYQLGAEKGYKQVNLIGKDGKVVGFASATRLDVVMP